MGPNELALCLVTVALLWGRSIFALALAHGGKPWG